MGFIMKENNIVVEKSLCFAKRIIKLHKYLVSEKKEYIISNQITRSGTSIGANIAEAECSMSQKDFLAKMYIAYKECAETQYWLRLLFETEYLDSNQYESIKSDCNELKKILSSITKTINTNK